MLNRCEFIGNLGADPEVTYTSSDLAITKFKVAVNWKTKDKTGTEWVSCVAFGKLGEICAQYLVKGKSVYVAGKMKTNTYEKDGVKKYFTSIELSEMEMLGGKGEGAAAAPPAQQQRGFDPPAEDEIPF